MFSGTHGTMAPIGAPASTWHATAGSSDGRVGFVGVLTVSSVLDFFKAAGTTSTDLFPGISGGTQAERRHTGREPALTQGCRNNAA